MDELWTLVNFEDGKPHNCVYPVDEGCGDDQGMIVYRSEHAAKVSAEHQNDMYDLDARPMLLSEVIEQGIK